MGVSEMSHCGIGWQIVDNTVDDKTVDGSLAHTLKPTRKIKKRTKALNTELKKFASLKSYSRYVNIKTRIMRNVTDNEDTDDDVGNRSNKLELTRNTSPIPGLYNTYGVSSRLDSTDEDFTTELPKKRRKKFGLSLDDKSNFYDTPDGERETAKNSGAARTHNFPRRCKNATSTKEKNPDDIKKSRTLLTKNKRVANIKKNLTFLWESMDGGNSPPSASKMTSPIAQSTQIYNDDNKFGEDEDAESVKDDDDEYRCRTKLESSFDVSDADVSGNVINEDGSMATDEISADGDEDEEDEMAKLAVSEEVCNDGEQDDKEIMESAESKEIDDDAEQEDKLITKLIESKEQDDDDAEQEDKLITKLIESKEQDDDDAEQEDKLITKLIESKEQDDDDAKQEYKLITKLIESGEQDDDDSEQEDKQITKLDESKNIDDDTEQKDVKPERISKLSESSVTDEQKLQPHNQCGTEETLTKRTQPVITCTQIVKGKYTIHRDDSKPDFDFSSPSKIPEKSQIEDELSDHNEVTEVDELSPQTKRIGQLKRFNLITNSSDSEDSEYEEEEKKDEKNQCNVDKNIISSCDSSIDESEDSDDEIVKSKVVSTMPTAPRSSLSQMISDPSDSDDEIDDTICDETLVQNPSTSSKTKSMKCYIREQENCGISKATDETNNIEEPMIEKITKKKKKKRNSETNNEDPNGDDVETMDDDVDDVDKRVSSKTGSNGGLSKDLARSVDDGSDVEAKGNDEDKTETLPRPLELHEFIERTGLVADRQLSTMTAKQFNAIARNNDDEEIWLMEIPKSIMTSKHALCGKKIAIEEDKITIDDVTYKTTSRDEKYLSCLLRGSKKKARYKTVNLEPVGYIIVRQEFPETSESSSLNESLAVARTDDAEHQSSITVPFPKNLKSRNPILGQDDNRKNVDVPVTPKRKLQFNGNETQQKIRKKSKRKRWQIDNFSE